jgi:O-antigen ligase
MGKNKQQSSADIMKHVQSISNITNDASNLERLNRWNSALRMFTDYPLTGTGPGTYQFIYAPYQHFRERTIISTNAGDRGNAHSEYLGPLAEEGIMGMLIYLLIVIGSLYYAFSNFRIIEDKRLKYLNLSIILGLITYFVHGILNNFLDTDKASALFWGFIAMLVAINIYHKKTNHPVET